MLEMLNQLKLEAGLLLITAWTWVQTAFTVQALGHFELLLHALTSVFILIIAGFRAFQIVFRHKRD